MNATATNVEDLRLIVTAALTSLNCPFEETQGEFHATIPESAKDWLPGNEELVFTFVQGPVSQVAAEAAEQISLDSPLLQSFLSAVDAKGSVLAVRPAGQPQSVHELTERLFAAYSFEKGKIGLAGCTLEDSPFVCRIVRNEQTDALEKQFFDTAGSRLEETFVERLGLNQLAPYTDRIPKTTPQADNGLIRQVADKQRADNRGDAAAAREVAWLLCFCKYATGKIRFSTDDEQSELEIPFSGWAIDLKAPEFVSEETGHKGYELDITDDHQITLAADIETCYESGRRVIATELVTCAATGQRVLPEYIVTCPVSGDQILESAHVECPTCRENVSPQALVRGGCKACVGTTKVSKADPRLARLLGEYPGLDRWNRWQLSETATAYIAEAIGIMKRILLVADKETLELRFVGSCSRLSRNWFPVSGADYEDLLK